MYLKRFIGPSLIVSMLLLAGCGGGGSSSTRSAVAVGAWGNQSQQVQVTVTSTGAAVTEGFSGGVIAKPMTTDGSGHFDVTGTYALDGPPPPPNGSVPTYAARYTGTVSGSSMTVTVTVSASPSYTLGPVTLTYGKVVTAPRPT